METIAGNSGQLKELWLGGAVFMRDQDYIPSRDPIVRVQARRLREKLTVYYLEEGPLDPVRIFLPVGTYVPIFSSVDPNCWASLKTGRGASVAVLPIKSIEGDRDARAFADEMTAELTLALVQAGGLEVVSGTSAAVFKGASQDVRAIGRLLNADFIVEGFVHRFEREHRIMLHLTAADTGYHCWAAWFEHRHTRMAPDARRIAALLHHQLLAGGTPILAAGRSMYAQVSALAN
jgi:TolB-like protein